MFVDRRRRVGLVVVALAAVAGVAVWLVFGRSADPLRRYEAARQVLNEGNDAEAFRIGRALQKSSDPELGHLLIGEVLVKQGRFDEAMDALNRVRPLGPRARVAGPLVGRCYLEMGRRRDAERVFTGVLQLDEDNVDAYRGLGALYYDQGDMARAVAALSAVGRLDPTDARPFRLIGVIQRDLNRLEEAQSAFQEAVRRVGLPDASENLRIDLADVLVRRQQDEEAARIIAGVSGPAADGIRARILFQAGRLDEALAMSWPHLDTQNVPRFILHMAAEIYLTRRQFLEAERTLQFALREDPSDLVAHQLMVKVLTAAGRSADARSAQSAFQKLSDELAELTKLQHRAMNDPWNAEVRHDLAVLCERIRRPDLAKMWRIAAAAAQASAP